MKISVHTRGDKTSNIMDHLTFLNNKWQGICPTIRCLGSQEAWKPSFERLLKESRSLGIGLKHMLTTVGQYDAPVLQKLFLFQQAGSGHSFPQHTDRQTDTVCKLRTCLRRSELPKRQKAKGKPAPKNNTFQRRFHGGTFMPSAIASADRGSLKL